MPPVLLIRLLIAVPLLGLCLSLFHDISRTLPVVLNWYHLADLPMGHYVAAIILLTGGATILVAHAIPPLHRPACYGLIIIAVLPLLTLLGPAHWIESLGGFPAIGSGQGIIKYFALLGLAVTLLLPAGRYHNICNMLNYLPVALVLLWIGGMKFTLLEAQGIEPLVASSPLMSWMYLLMDVQTTSNVIGIYDLLALVVLGAGLFFRALLIPGLLMCAAVFVTTQTFIMSYSGALDQNVLSGTGMFIIKDIWFVANLLVLYYLNTPGLIKQEN